MSDWGPSRPYLRVNVGYGACQARCGNCDARVAMSDTHCTIYPSLIAGGKETGCGQRFDYYITPYPDDREEIEQLTRLPYKRVAWG